MPGPTSKRYLKQNAETRMHRTSIFVAALDPSSGFGCGRGRRGFHKSCSSGFSYPCRRPVVEETPAFDTRRRHAWAGFVMESGSNMTELDYV